MKKEKECFVIAPIGEQNTDIRKRSDQIFKHIISPALQPLGYKPVRANHISEPGMITTQVIQHVVEAPLVIADLTGRNPNVFYELAIRHAIKKPLIQLIKKEEQIPFDVAGTRTIKFDIHDLDSAEQTKQELIKQIKSIEQGKTEIDTPISVALDLKILKESENPEQRSLADVIENLSVLRSGILALEKKMSNPESLIPPSYIDSIARRVSRQRSISREALPELRQRIENLLEIVERKTPRSREMLMIRDGLHTLRDIMSSYIHREP